MIGCTVPDPWLGRVAARGFTTCDPICRVTAAAGGSETEPVGRVLQYGHR